MNIITQKPQVAEVIRKFKSNIIQRATAQRKVTIGYPGGSFTAFAHEFLNQHIWVHVKTVNDKKTKALIHVGYGELCTTGGNNITVEINPHFKADLRPSGYLLESEGDFYLAHTGQVHRSGGGRPQLETEQFPRESHANENNKTKDLYRITKILDSDGETPQAALADLAIYAKLVFRLKNPNEPKVDSVVDILGDEEGGKTRTDGWVYLRSKRLVRSRKERDDFTCTLCGFRHERKVVHVHHKIPISTKKEAAITDIDDLVTLCPNCHALAHFVLREHPGALWEDVTKQVQNITREL